MIMILIDQLRKKMFTVDQIYAEKHIKHINKKISQISLKNIT